MVGQTYKVGAVSALLAMGLLAGSGTVSAQTSGKGTRPTHVHAAPLKGTITSLGTGSFQLQTQTGSVTIPYTTKTHVALVKAGTTADLKPNARVSLHLVSGTAADSVEVSAAKPAGTKTTTTTKHAVSKTWTKPTGTTPTTHTRTGTPTHVAGQVVSFDATTNTLVIARGHGQSNATYTLTANAGITTVSAGTTSNLAKGQSVQVIASSTGAAVAIVILNA